MEVHDFALQHLIARLGYQRREGPIIDRRGTLAQKMTEHLGLPRSSVDEIGAEATSEDRRDRFRIGIAQLLASVLSVEDWDRQVEQLRGFFDMSLQALEHPAIAEVSVHTSDIAPVDSLDELRARLLDAHVDRAATLREAVGPKLADATWNFKFEDEGSVFDVRFTAVEESSLRTYLSDPEGGDYPPFSLLLDIKAVFRAQGAAGRDPLLRFEEAAQSNRTVRDRVGRWLRESVS